MIEAAETSLFKKGEKLLTRKDVQEKTSLGSTTIHRYMETQGFPRPVRVGPNASRWRESEVDAWIAGLTPSSREAASQ